MTEGDAPKSWIGGKVTIGVGRNTTGQQFTGVLEEVNDMGVVMYFQDVPETPPHYVFYPWRLVQAIQVPEEGRPERRPDPMQSGSFVHSEDPFYPESEDPYRSS